ncbi:putative C-terminal motor kinesin [Trypanosoma theileri]|uniref:Putative C-terminal motor kinesin n=1 Tax=Trypanosoma theileri TaxID=67003 RepID=A0A1X0NSZ0_9TRYP|nr:putative C-terminal motor kinesin [Trypanosoma theileri]ORC87835.1 putative C-terminal motor kinesin [Trypanosoma theileri]
MLTARSYNSMPSQVRIVVRTRPTNFVTNNFHVMSNNTLCITRPNNGDVSTGNATRANTKTASPGGTSVEENLTFTADAILQDAPQELVYNTAAADLVEAVVQGFNCTLLCHGQSGSGKTYTLFGGNTYPTRGCVPRAIQAVFDSIKLSSEREFKVSLTFVEVYGEQVYDLLGRGPSAAAVLAAAAKIGGKESGNVNKASVTIDTSGAVVLRGVDERVCVSEGEALAAVFEGLQRRLCGANPLNPQSSRSHAVLTLYVVSKSLIDSDAVVHHSRCNFVDLASSDRPYAAGDEAAAQETRVINKSLAMLEQVVLALAAHRPRHVPYRQSKLTMLLKDSIGGSSRTTLIANVWPEPRHTEATIATLNFAKRMMRVESKPAMHASMDPEAQIKMLQKQLLSLKAELRMQDQLAGREAVATAPLETDEIQTARERVEAFIEGSIPQVSVTCVREMHACFLAFKSILEERDTMMKDMEHQLAITTPRPGSSCSAKSTAKRKYSTRQNNNSESRETTRYVTSSMDTTTGVGVGSTDKLSPGLREMFQQQQRNVSFSAHAGHNTSPGRVSGADYVITSVMDGTVPSTAGTTPATTRATTSTTTATTVSPQAITAASQNTMAGSVATSAAVAASKVASSTTNFSTPNDEELMKGRFYPPTSSYSPAREAYENTLSPAEQQASTAPLPSVKGIGRQEGVVRDKRLAFEMYKRTPNGACQLEVINNAQKLVAEKNEEILRLQQRVQEIKADMESNKKGQSVGMQRIEERVVSRYATSQTGRVSVDVSEGSDAVNENNNTTTTTNNNNNNNTNNDNESILAANLLRASLTEDLRNMSATEKKALLSHTTRAVTRALTERGVLVKQLNRHREAFMNNFQYWYKSSLQSTILPQKGKTGTESVGGSDTLPTLKSVNSSLPTTGTPRVTIFTEGDIRFIDGGEQFEAAEMQRRLQKDPDGVAFYAAQDLVKKRLSTRQ